MIYHVYVIIGFDDSVLRYIRARSAKEAVKRYLSVGGDLAKISYVSRLCLENKWR